MTVTLGWQDDPPQVTVIGYQPFNWVAVILLFLSIPLLVVGKRKGWWLATLAAITILMIDVPTQFFRTKTLDYLYGSLLALGVLFFTQVPFFKKKLLQAEDQTT